MLCLVLVCASARAHQHYCSSDVFPEQNYRFFFSALFDLGTDWAFWDLELSSEGFRNAYECIPAEPLTRCTATDRIYACSSYGALNDPCRGNPEAIGDSPATECACYGHSCFRGCLVYNPISGDWDKKSYSEYTETGADTEYCIGDAASSGRDAD